MARKADHEILPCTVPNLAINSGLSGSRMSAATKLPRSPGHGSMQPFPSLNLFISIRYVSRFLAKNNKIHFSIIWKTDLKLSAPIPKCPT